MALRIAFLKLLVVPVAQPFCKRAFKIFTTSEIQFFTSFDLLAVDTKHPLIVYADGGVNKYLSHVSGNCFTFRSIGRWIYEWSI